METTPTEVKSIIPASFIESYNKDQDVVEDPHEKEEELPGLEQGKDWEYLDFEEEEDGEESPDWLNDLEDMEEGAGEEGIGEDDIEGFGQLLVDLIQTGKDLLEDYYDEAFARILKKKFTKEEQTYLVVVETAYMEEKLHVNGLAEVLDNVKKHSNKFEGLEYHTLLSIGNRYKRLRKRYQSQELKDYQKAGIEKYMKLTIRKYLMDVKLDPLAMLLIYLGISFFPDGRNLWHHWRESKREAE